jgi:hypothetical protein
VIGRRLPLGHKRFRALEGGAEAGLGSCPDLFDKAPLKRLAPAGAALVLVAALAGFLRRCRCGGDTRESLPEQVSNRVVMVGLLRPLRCFRNGLRRSRGYSSSWLWPRS